MVFIGFLRKWNRERWGVFFLIFLLCLVLAVDAGCKIQETQETRVLAIEELRTGRILWQTQIKQGDIILYENNHSVYKDRVYQTYEVSPEWSFILIKVASSPKVIFSPYPGFELSPKAAEQSGDLIEVNLSKEQDNLIIAVGGELTDNRLTIGQRSVNFIQLVGDGAIIRIYIKEPTRR